MVKLNLDKLFRKDPWENHSYNGVIKLKEKIALIKLTNMSRQCGCYLKGVRQKCVAILESIGAKA